MSKKIEITREKLVKLTETKTVAEIANMYHCSVRTVYNWYERFQLEFKRVDRKDIQLPSRYTYNKAFFSTIDTEHKAYWLGFIMADGCILQKSKNKPCLTLIINLQDSDSKHLEKFNDDLEGNLPIRHYVTKESEINSWNGIVKIQPGTYCKIEVNSKWLCLDLIKHGVTQRKTLHEHSPLMEVPELSRHFIRGFFDGDGCFSAVKPKSKPREYAKVFIASGEEIITYIMNNVFQDIGVMMGRDKYHVLDRCYIQNEQDFIKFVRYLYKDSTIYLDRKKELIDSYMRRYSLNI